VPHGELLVPGLILLVIGLVLVTVAGFWPESKRATIATLAPVETLALPAATEMTGPVTAFTQPLTWPTLIDPDAGDLADAERAHIIEGLAIVGVAWAAAILARAFDEESDDLRIAAVEALGHCDAEIVGPTLERAYSSYVIAERYAAVDGASRRADIPLLERALRDTDGSVALAAAYGLHRAGQAALIDTNLAEREDARANEIRRVLPILV
jgi:HEAT repeat protein